MREAMQNGLTRFGGHVHALVSAAEDVALEDLMKAWKGGSSLEPFHQEETLSWVS